MNCKKLNLAVVGKPNESGSLEGKNLAAQWDWADE